MDQKEIYQTLITVEPTYTEEQLAELAKGVFNDDKTSPSIYANEVGTFRNSVQYAAMSDEEKKTFPFEFKNPNVKSVEVSVVDTEAITALQSQLDEANAEIARLNGLKSISAAKDLQAQLDAANAKIAELTAAPTPAP